MPKSKYKFDPDSLSYDRVTLSPKQKVGKFFKQLAYVSVVAAMLLFILSFLFDTPGESEQKRENKQLLLQYEILNKKLDHMENTMAKIQERDDNIYRVIFNAEPYSAAKRAAGYGGVNKYKELEGYSNSELVIETKKKLDKLSNKMGAQLRSYEEVVSMAKEKEALLSSLPAISPVADKDLTRFASGFGYRIHPIYRTRKMHSGIDLTAPTGTPVYSTGDGKVIKAGYRPGGYGKRIIIDHGFGFKTLYAHLHEIDVKVGQKIKRGELIGKVGNTGRSTAPHLHYEVRKHNRPENPVNYYSNDLTPEQYQEVIEISSRMNMSFD